MANPERPLGRYTLPLVVGVLVTIWGSTWVVIAEGLDDMPPLTSAGYRFVIAALVMVLLAGFIARREGGVRPPLHLTLVQGSCNFAISYALTYRAEVVLPSGLVAVLWALFPVFTALAAPLILPEERFAPRQWLGLMTAVGGVMILFWTDIRELAEAHSGVWSAAGWLICAPLISALGTAWIKRHGATVSSAYLNRDGLILGAGLLMGAAWVFEGNEPVTWTPKAMGALAYLSLIGTVLTFGLYFWAVRHAPVWQLSLIALLTPPLALLLGNLVRGEAVSSWTLVGLGVILAGVVGVIFGSVRRSVPK